MQNSLCSTTTTTAAPPIDTTITPDSYTKPDKILNEEDLAQAQEYKPEPTSFEEIGAILCAQLTATFVYSEFLEYWLPVEDRNNCQRMCSACQASPPKRRGKDGETITIPCTGGC
jgi:hypothetical protein